MTDTPPTEPPQAPQVEKPKRNWRGWLKEYAIIVIGVLTALGAEQAVEWLHWRNQVQAGREVIATEMAFNLEGAIWRVRAADCVEKRLDFLSRVLDDASRSGNLPPVGYISQPPRHQWRSGAWESVVASQTASHYSRQQLAQLAALYKVLQRMEEFATQENMGWGDLYTMVGPGRRLDSASEAALRAAISRMRNSARVEGTLSRQLITQAHGMDLPFTSADRKLIGSAKVQQLAICNPVGPVPSGYGEGPIQENVAGLNAAAKSLPDFGGP